MANYVATATRIYLGSLDLSGTANEVDFGSLQVAMADCTTFNDGGYVCVKPGLKKGSGHIHGYQDYATGGLSQTMDIPAQLGSQFAYTVIPNPTGTVTAADTSYIARGVISEFNPLEATVGEMAGYDITIDYDIAFGRSVVLAPLAAQTVTTTGTAVQIAGPTATQKLYAALHVTAYSGLTNAIFTIQSDDAVGFPSQTTRATFTTVTGVTSEWLTPVAGPWASETHHRVLATLSGVGSITYTVSMFIL